MPQTGQPPGAGQCQHTGQKQTGPAPQRCAARLWAPERERTAQPARMRLQTPGWCAHPCRLVSQRSKVMAHAASHGASVRASARCPSLLFAQKRMPEHRQADARLFAVMHAHTRRHASVQQYNVIAVEASHEGGMQLRSLLQSGQRGQQRHEALLAALLGCDRQIGCHLRCCQRKLRTQKTYMAMGCLSMPDRFHEMARGETAQQLLSDCRLRHAI